MSVENQGHDGDHSPPTSSGGSGASGRPVGAAVPGGAQLPHGVPAPPTQAPVHAGATPPSFPKAGPVPQPGMFPPGPQQLPQPYGHYPQGYGYGFPLTPEQVAQQQRARKERDQNRTVNITLYMASLLFVVAGAFFVVSPTEPGIRFTAVALLTAAFYGAGLILHRSVATLRPAALAIVGTGMALIPVAGIALDALLIHHLQLSWLLTSLVGLGAYVFAATRLESKVVGFLAVGFFASTMLSATQLAGAAALWTIVILVLVSAAVTFFCRRMPAGKGPMLLEPLRTLEVWFVPAIAVGAVLFIRDFEDWQWAVVFAVFTIFWCVRSIVDQGPSRAPQMYAARAAFVIALFFALQAFAGGWPWSALAPTVALSVQAALVHRWKALPVPGGAKGRTLDSIITYAVAVVVAVFLTVALTARARGRFGSSTYFSPDGRYAEYFWTSVVITVLAVLVLSVAGAIISTHFRGFQHLLPAASILPALTLAPWDGKAVVMWLVIMPVFWLVRGRHTGTEGRILQVLAASALVWLVPRAVLELFPHAVGKSSVASIALVLGALVVLGLGVLKPAADAPRWVTHASRAIPALYVAIGLPWIVVAVDSHLASLTIWLGLAALFLSAAVLVICASLRVREAQEPILTWAPSVVLAVWTFISWLFLAMARGDTGWSAVAPIIGAVAIWFSARVAAPLLRRSQQAVARLVGGLGLIGLYAAQLDGNAVLQGWSGRPGVALFAVVVFVLLAVSPILRLHQGRAVDLEPRVPEAHKRFTLDSLAWTEVISLVGIMGVTAMMASRYFYGSSRRMTSMVGPEELWQTFTILVLCVLVASLPAILRPGNPLAPMALGLGSGLMGLVVATLPRGDGSLAAIILTSMILLACLLVGMRAVPGWTRDGYFLAARTASLALLWAVLVHIKADAPISLLAVIAFCILQHLVTAATSRTTNPAVVLAARWSVLAVHALAVLIYCFGYARGGDYWWGLLAVVSLVMASVIIAVRSRTAWFLFGITFAALALVPASFGTRSPLLGGRAASVLSMNTQVLFGVVLMIAAIALRFFPRWAPEVQRRLLWLTSVGVLTLQAWFVAAPLMASPRGWAVFLPLLVAGLVLAAAAFDARNPVLFSIGLSVFAVGGLGLAAKAFNVDGISGTDRALGTIGIDVLIAVLCYIPYFSSRVRDIIGRHAVTAPVVSSVVLLVATFVAMNHYRLDWLPPLLVVLAVAALLPAARGVGRMVVLDLGVLSVVLLTYRAMVRELNLDAGADWVLLVLALCALGIGLIHHLTKGGRVQSSQAAPGGQMSTGGAGVAGPGPSAGVPQSDTQGVVFAYIGAGLLTLASLISIGDPEAVKQVMLIAAFALLLVLGLAMGKPVFAWWGAAGIILVVVIMLRANVYLWLGIIAAVLIGAVVITLLRRKPQPGGTAAAARGEAPQFHPFPGQGRWPANGQDPGQYAAHYPAQYPIPYQGQADQQGQPGQFMYPAQGQPVQPYAPGQPGYAQQGQYPAPGQPVQPYAPGQPGYAQQGQYPAPGQSPEFFQPDSHPQQGQYPQSGPRPLPGQYPQQGPWQPPQFQPQSQVPPVPGRAPASDPGQNRGAAAAPDESGQHQAPPTAE